MTKIDRLKINSTLIIGLLVFIVLCLLVAWYYRNDIFQSLLDPGEPYQTYQKPTAPNYERVEGWMALPDLNVDSYNDQTLGDVFIVAPGIYKGGEHWNLPIDDEDRIEKLQHIVRPNYIKPYGNAGRLFAPHYRQASLYTFMTAREDAKLAQDLAYQDVKRAFAFFLKHSPPERPVVLVGHGQGGSHVQRLLSDFFQGDLKKRLAVAYVIDHPLPLDKFDADFHGLVPCETETDTQCVVAFGAFMPGDDVIAERFLTRLKVHDGKHYDMVAGRPLLCTNPLLWNRSSDYAPRRLHQGGVAAIGLDPETQPAPLKKQAGAQCQDGILYVDRPKSASLRRPLKFGGKFRTLPSNLFYEDLRINAQKRVQALIDTTEIPRRVETMDNLDIIEIIDSPVEPIKEK